MDEFIKVVTDNILTPAILIIASAVIIIVKNYAKKISDSIVTKNEIDALEKTQAAKEKILKEVASAVEAAVGSNMQTANDIKASGNKLTDEQSDELKNNAKKIALASLPTSITDEDGSLMKIIGGKEKLDIIIDSYIEKYVYEYQVKEGKK